MGDELAEALERDLDARISALPSVPEVSYVIRRGVVRRRTRRLGLATVALLLGAAAVTLPRFDFLAQVRDEQLQPVRAGVQRIGRMTVPRAAHGATLLDDGRVLITGGFSGSTEIYYDSTEIFDPATRTFLPSAPMTTPRTGHASVLLEGGRVLIIGGWGNAFLDSAELFDPSTGLFSSTASMTTTRDGFTATRLSDGRVLVVGGFRSSYDTFNRKAEIYDPSEGTFSVVGSLRHARASHSATLLPNGQVLISGGLGPKGVLRSIEIFDPPTGEFRPGGRMAVGRQKHGATLLDNGKVLIVGGANINDSQGLIDNAELYNAHKMTSRSVDDMADARFKLPSPINLPGSAEVLVIGGADSGELYEETSRGFSTLSGQFEGAQSFPTATLLADGTVLVTGGYDQNVTATDSAWLYASASSSP